MPLLLFGLFDLNDLLVDVTIDKQPPETGLATPFNLGSYHHGLCHFAFSTIQHCVAPFRVGLCLLLSIFVVAVLGCSTF